MLTDQQAEEMLSRLTSYCKEYSLSVNDAELRKCIQHLDLVLETNKTTNLTRILNVEDAVVLHILDSLVLIPYIRCCDFHSAFHPFALRCRQLSYR